MSVPGYDGSNVSTRLDTANLLTTRICFLVVLQVVEISATVDLLLLLSPAPLALSVANLLDKFADLCS